MANSTELGEGFEDFMASIEESMIKLMKESAKIPQDLREHWEAFASAINWEEPFIRNLLICHAVLYLITLLTKNYINIQSIIFFSICGVLFFCEQLNRYCHHHWQELTTQNYFDEHGVFTGIFFAGPLLLLLFLQLINFLAFASTKLIEVKRMELKRKKAKAATAITTAGDLSENTTSIESTRTREEAVQAKKND